MCIVARALVGREADEGRLQMIAWVQLLIYLSFKLLIQFRFARHRPLRYPDRPRKETNACCDGADRMAIPFPRTFLKRPPAEPSLSGQQIIWKLLMVGKFPLCARTSSAPGDLIRLSLLLSSSSPRFAFNFGIQLKLSSNELRFGALSSNAFLNN